MQSLYLSFFFEVNFKNSGIIDYDQWVLVCSQVKKKNEYKQQPFLFKTPLPLLSLSIPVKYGL